jgi:hypothetical protein
LHDHAGQNLPRNGTRPGHVLQTSEDLWSLGVIMTKCNCQCNNEKSLRFRHECAMEHPEFRGLAADIAVPQPKIALAVRRQREIHADAVLELMDALKAVQDLLLLLPNTHFVADRRTVERGIRDALDRAELWKPV